MAWGVWRTVWAGWAAKMMSMAAIHRSAWTEAAIHRWARTAATGGGSSVRTWWRRRGIGAKSLTSAPLCPIYAACKNFAETIIEFIRLCFYNLGLKFVVLSGKIVAVTLSACNCTACIHAVKIEIDAGSFMYCFMLVHSQSKWRSKVYVLNKVAKMM
jgi:hypothetical protein